MEFHWEPTSLNVAKKLVYNGAVEADDAEGVGK